MPIDSSKPSAFVCRAAALALFTSACAAPLFAQQPDSTPAPAVVQTDAPKLDLKHFDLSSLDLADADGVGYSSSATPVSDATQTATLDFKGLDALQPPPRRRYGRPRYQDSNHNADGSPKYAFIAGVGLGGIPVGNLHKYDTPSYGFQVGGGRNFNKNFGVLLQFDYDHFGYQGQTLTNQSLIYFGATGQGLDGTSHIWSFTLDPTYSVFSRESVGAYVVGGVGFYHKTANFTIPATGTYCDYYYGCYQYEANETIDKYTSNAVGFNGGFGLTFKPSRFASEKFYIEGRYVFVDNQNRPGGVTVANAASAPVTATNLFPANGNKSTYIPIKVGLRF